MIIEGIEIRPSVLKFAKAMEEKLKENDHKGGWESEDMGYLFKRLDEEVLELKYAYSRWPSRIATKQESVDVANFAMMIFDNLS